ADAPIRAQLGNEARRARRSRLLMTLSPCMPKRWAAPVPTILERLQLRIAGLRPTAGRSQDGAAERDACGSCKGCGRMKDMQSPLCIDALSLERRHCRTSLF